MARNTALFQQPTSTAQSRNIVEFRAGKLNLRENNWVQADTRKGLAYVHQSDDGLMHFCWKDRKTGVVEDDLIVFPDETEYMKVPQCTTGRAFLLKFKNAKKFFLWMQEPSTDRDEEFCKKVNDTLNNPPPAPSRSRAPAGMGGIAPQDMQELLGSLNMSQSELMALLSMGIGMGGNRSTGSDSESSSRVQSSSGGTRPVASSAGSTVQPSRAAPETPDTAAADAITGGARPGGRIQLQDLQNILSSLGESEASRPASVDLTDVMNVEHLSPFLSNEAVLARLRPHLPAGEESTSDRATVEGNIRSPQFRTAVKAFSSALQTGEMAPVIAQFNLGTKVNEAAQKGDIVAFGKAMEEAMKKKEEEKKEGEGQQPEKMDEN